MVISHKYKYVFIELPRTATTAIVEELIKFYDGENILYKHSSYRELKKYYNNEYSDYFVFACIRNPLDRTVSLYEKLKTNDRGYNVHPYFQLRANYLKKNGFFEDYFLKYYKLPYDDWGSLDHDKFDFIIYFETLQEDFRTVLKRLNIKQVRNIPTANKTKMKKDYWSYYTPRIQKRATHVFGPYCIKFGYEFPWKIKTTPFQYILLYKTLFVFRKVVWIQMKDRIIKKHIKKMGAIP